MAGHYLEAFVFEAANAVVAALVGAIFLRLATRWRCGFWPPYGAACWASLLAYLAGRVTQFSVHAMVGPLVTADLGPEAHAFIPLLVLVIDFPISGAVFGRTVKHPETGPIGFGRGCSVTLALVLMGLAIYGIVGLMGYIAGRV